MIPFMLALMCITGLHQKSQCPTKTPVSSHQLHKIWSPTVQYNERLAKYARGYWTTTTLPPDVSSLRGRKLKIAAIVEPPYVNNIANNTLEGVAKTVITVLREKLGFDYEVVTPLDGTVGIYNETDKTWSGILGMLQRGEADFSIQFISMLPIRTAIGTGINFSMPFGEERWVIMMQRPMETTNGEGLVAPFQTFVWYCLLVALVVMGPLVYIMVKLRCHACRLYPHLTLPYSFGHCVWFVYGALMKQGSVLKPIADSSRILFATWWIFVTILTAFYTANLTAYLTLSKIPIPYDQISKIGFRDYWITKDGDTIEQILRLKAPINGTHPDEIFYRAEVPHPEFVKLRWRLGQSNAYGKFEKNFDKMVNEVRRNKYLLLEEQSRVERAIYKDFRSQSRKQTELKLRCAFIMSRNAILRVPYGFAFKDKELVHMFKKVLNDLVIGGLFDYWRREDLPVKDPCSQDSDFRERQLRNGDLMTTYILCGCGYSLGTLSFIMEIVFRWIANRKMKGQLMPLEKNNLSFYKGNLTVPSGAPTYFDTEKFLKNINGRDYIVMKTPDGRTRLVPKNNGLQALQPVYQPPPPISYSFMS